MLTLMIALPLATVLLLLPFRNARTIRAIALAGTLAVLAVAVAAAVRFDSHGPALQLRETIAWIPSIGARYDVALTGLSVALVLLTALIMAVVAASLLGHGDRAKGHAALFLLLEAGLIGVFCAQDLLLFYLFFEVALVPMYFVIGIWGSDNRRYAALKFFLYTRAGSLAMLLGILSLYLSMTPHSFSLPAIIAAQPLAHAPTAAAATLFALLIGFGVKLPIVPLHNWLPDAHVEAPTEGSVVLAGLQLKMGGYGLLAILLPTLGSAVARFAWLFIAIGLVSLIYGALLPLVQRDLKRLIAFTSINHLGYVPVALGVAALAGNHGVAQLAVDGATLQMISHGLLTGAMFLLIGMIQHRTGTRDIDRLRGLWITMPGLSGVLALVAFGSFGLPGLSGFVAELQVIGATLAQSVWVAVVIVVALVIMTAVYLRVVTRLLLGEPSEETARLAGFGRWQLAPATALTAMSVLIGILPGAIVTMIAASAPLVAR